METLEAINVSIPLWQIVLLGIIALLCILSDRVKMGLLATFVFVFYWGLVTNFSQDGTSIISFQLFDVLYLFIGLSMSMLFLLVLFFIPNE
jgi:hypothetical protein